MHCYHLESQNNSWKQSYAFSAPIIGTLWECCLCKTTSGECSGWQINISEYQIKATFKRLSNRPSATQRQSFFGCPRSIIPRTETMYFLSSSESNFLSNFLTKYQSQGHWHYTIIVFPVIACISLGIGSHSCSAEMVLYPGPFVCEIEYSATGLTE